MLKLKNVQGTKDKLQLVLLKDDYPIIVLMDLTTGYIGSLQEPLLSKNERSDLVNILNRFQQAFKVGEYAE